MAQVYFSWLIESYKGEQILRNVVPAVEEVLQSLK